MEIAARHIGEPQGHVRQFRKSFLPGRIGNKTGRIDEDLALIQLRLQQIRKYSDRGSVGTFRRSDADADGTYEDAVEINAENPGIGQVVKTVGDPSIAIWLDGALLEIGAVAETIDGVLFRFGPRQAIVDLVEQLNPAPKGPVCRFLSGTHVAPPTLRRMPDADNQKVNAFLPQVQSNRAIRVNRGNELLSLPAGIISQSERD